jgi:hypothetical protein
MPEQPYRLSQPQKTLLDKMRAGARLRHGQADGVFRLQDGPIERAVSPATVIALIKANVVHKDMTGVCRLVSPSFNRPEDGGKP